MRFTAEVKSLFNILHINLKFTTLSAFIFGLVYITVPIQAGTFTPSTSNGVTSVSGSITSNGGVGTYTLTRTGSSDYKLVNFTGGANGIQAANQHNFDISIPDSFTYNFTVTPPTGYAAQIVVTQANYATGGNSEASNRIITWVGADAIVTDPSNLTRADGSSGADTDYPPYNGGNIGCTRGTVFETDGEQHQIQDINNNGTLTSGDSFVSYSVDNLKAQWAITLPSGTNEVTLQNTTLATPTIPAFLDSSGSCVEINKNPNESFQEWITFNVEFIVAPLSADLSVTKTLTSTGPYSSGDTVTYTINVSNAGSDDATNIVVEDLPTNLTNLNITSATTCTTGPVTAGVICTISSLTATASETITIQATVP